MSESHVTWATSVPILILLGLSVLDLGPMYATDRQTSDSIISTQQLINHLLGVGHNKLNINLLAQLNPCRFWLSNNFPKNARHKCLKQAICSFFKKNPKNIFAGNFLALFMQFTHGNFCVNQNGADLWKWHWINHNHVPNSNFNTCHRLCCVVGNNIPNRLLLGQWQDLLACCSWHYCQGWILLTKTLIFPKGLEAQRK